VETCTAQIQDKCHNHLSQQQEAAAKTDRKVKQEASIKEIPVLDCQGN